MAKFSYRARDNTGKTVGGNLDAADTRQAVEKLRAMGYWPLEIKQNSGTVAAGPRSGKSAFWDLVSIVWTGVSMKTQALFFRQFATMLQAGMSIGEALDNLGRQRGLGRLAQIARQAAEHVRAGGRFSEVMAACPRIFSKIQIGLVIAGETGGMFDRMVERIATHLERELEIRRKFAKTTFYPKLVAVAILVIPQIPGLVLGGPEASRMFLLRMIYILLLLAGAYIVLKSLLIVPSLRTIWDMLKISFPVLGSAVRKLAMSRISTALSVLYSAGIPIARAVELSSEAAGNEVLRRAFAKTVPELRRGGPLSYALKRAGSVPQLVLDMVETGERTGNLDRVLDKVSEYYDSEADATIEKFGVLLFVLLILAAGVFVGIIVVQFYGQYYRGLGL